MSGPRISPLDDDEDVFDELPGGDRPGRLPREAGGGREDKDPAASELDDARGDDRDGDGGGDLDQLGKSRRHNRRLERRLKGMAAENAGLREQVRAHGELLTKLSRDRLRDDVRSAQGSVEAAEQRLIQARDDSDRKAEIDAERDLHTARGRLAALERAVSSADEERRPAADRGGEEQQPDPEGMALAAAWTRKNPWYGTEDALEDSQIAQAVSVAIANDRENPIPIDDPEHYEELTRRLRRRMPERFKPARRAEDGDVDDDPDVPGTRGSARRTAFGGGGGGGDDLPATLTQRQIRVYEAMGFNWNKKEDRERIIAQEKLHVEERRGRRNAY